MTYTIDKNVPIPKASKYPLKEMNMGESFGIPKDGNTSDREIVSRVCAAAYAASKRTGYKYTICTLPTELRIWRIK